MTTADGPPLQPETRWQQVTVEFTDYAAAEKITADRLRPVMNTVAKAWWFIRKAPCWRLRYLPEQPDAGAEARRVVARTLKNLHDNSGGIANSVEAIYEPEIHAFGGSSGMSVAHTLFHHDSQHILDHLAHPRDHRREHTVLLCSAMLRASGLEWYEQGDVWARVAENRPLPPDIAPEHLRRVQAGLRRLMTVDANPDSPLAGPHGQLAGIGAWLSAFHNAGTEVGALARAGKLERGLRAVLAHQVIFHWNRIGLSYAEQGVLTHGAKAVVFGD
ncbi:thiopeptide-type bacteriocin biosynthesis protein [Amycolatopsis sp. NPDC051371]|uniref:thiopeptide-type bacteriocin biosynthesis protein n=1 Tax=Amycolatopsis sp. NPDC051371 TaxID=3155800 RepID=UPI00343C48F3